MVETLPSSRNRRYSWASSPWTPYLGDLKALETFLDSKTGVVWLLPKFVDSLLRGIGQVAFANNPITGFVILCVLFWAGLAVGLATLLAATTAILTAVIMRQDTSNIRAGLTTFNAVLVGCVTASLWTPLFNEPLPSKVWLFIVLGAVLSVFIASGLGNILSKWSLPGLTLPFNIVTLLLFVCLMPPELVTSTMKNTDNVTIPEAETNETTHLNWGQVTNGVFLSMGEVFAVDTLAGSIFLLLGILIYSPLLAVMGFLGALVGTLFGLVIVPVDSFSKIYLGIWGYNGVLSASAIGGFFFAFNTHSCITGLLNVIFTVLIQHALALSFTTVRLPVLTLPFCLSTFLFLSVTTTKKYLVRVSNISFPEMHRHEYVQELRLAETAFIGQGRET